MNTFSSVQLKEANDAVAAGMAFVLPLWFVPIPVVGSAACNAAEAIMVKNVLKALRPAAGEKEGDALFWFFRKKYLLVNVATFVPYAGPAVQLLEAFGLGRFVMVCCERGISLDDEVAMGAAFNSIEPALWDPEGVIQFYENATGETFPPKVRGPFTTAVNGIRAVVETTNAIPGMRAGQELLGEGLRKTISWVKSPFKK